MHSKSCIYNSAATDVVAPAIKTLFLLPLLSTIDRKDAAVEVAIAQSPPVTSTLRVCQTTKMTGTHLLVATDKLSNPIC